MSEQLQILVPNNQPELEAAFYEFVQDEFQQEVKFKEAEATGLNTKNLELLEGLYQVIEIMAEVETALQLTDRARRMERVKKLEKAIKKAGKPVYMRIKNRTVNMYGKSVDQIMNLLAGDDKD